MKEIKANPLSFLNKVVPFPQNKYYYLGMIAVAAAAVAEWNHFLVFELRSFANKNQCVYSLIFKAFFVCLNS